jgi:hypothetical protein
VIAVGRRLYVPEPSTSIAVRISWLRSLFIGQLERIGKEWNKNQ